MRNAPSWRPRRACMALAIPPSAIILFCESCRLSRIASMFAPDIHRYTTIVPLLNQTVATTFRVGNVGELTFFDVFTSRLHRQFYKLIFLHGRLGPVQPCPLTNCLTLTYTCAPVQQLSPSTQGIIHRVRAPFHNIWSAQNIGFQQETIYHCVPCSSTWPDLCT